MRTPCGRTGVVLAVAATTNRGLGAVVATTPHLRRAEPTGRRRPDAAAGRRQSATTPPTPCARATGADAESPAAPTAVSLPPRATGSRDSFTARMAG